MAIDRGPGGAVCSIKPIPGHADHLLRTVCLHYRYLTIKCTVRSSSVFIKPSPIVHRPPRGAVAQATCPPTSRYLVRGTIATLDLAIHSTNHSAQPMSPTSTLTVVHRRSASFPDRPLEQLIYGGDALSASAIARPPQSPETPDRPNQHGAICLVSDQS